MKIYDLETLRTQAIYEQDAELATIARKVAIENFPALGEGRMGTGDLKREFLAGKHAELVFEYLEKLNTQEYEAVREYHRLLDALLEVMPPEGVTIDVDGQYLKIKAPYDGGDLNRRLNRQGGRWDDYNKCSIVPLSTAESLPKIFSNWEKKYQQTQQAKVVATAQRKAEQEKARQERQAAWAAQRQQEAQQRKAQREAEEQRRAKAVASRVQVVAGEYKIGDLLNGRQIIGFGKSWTEATLSGGQLYQECDYGRCQGEPVCVHCFKCGRHCGCDVETFCYAYFE